MRTIILFLVAASLFATGGQMEPPPFNTQEGANLFTNGGFETGDFTGWTKHACVEPDATVSYEGTYSAKGVNCPASIFPLQQSVATGTTGSLMFRGRFKFDANMTGTIELEFRAAGGTFLQSVAPRIRWDQAPGGDWIDFHQEVIVPERHFGNLSLRVRTQGVTGTFWMDNLEAVHTWKPLRNFVKYPNFHGFLFQGADPWQCSEFGTEEICGVSEIIPPNGETLASMTLSVKLATVAGCATGVVDTVSVAVPIATQLWSFNGSGLTLDTDYYLCPSLLRTSDSTVLDTYPDHKITKRTTAYRDALVNWIDDRGRWYHQGKARLAWGTYFRASVSGGVFTCSGCNWSNNLCGPKGPAAATAKDCHIYSIIGYSRTALPKAKGSEMVNVSPQPPNNSAFLADMAKTRMNVSIFEFKNGIMRDPRDASNELTPAVEALSEFGVAYLQISNHWDGYLLSGTETPVAPAAPGLEVAATGGSISSAYVWVRVAGIKMKGNHGRDLSQTAGSVSSRNTAALTGSTNKVTVTVPTCNTVVPLGFYVYAATSADTTEPDSSLFTRQSNFPTDCGGIITLTAVRDTKLLVPTSDNTLGNYRPFSGFTDDQGWTLAANKITAGKGAGFYICDECRPGSYRAAFKKAKFVREIAPGLLTWGVPDIYPTAAMYTRDILDVPSNDPYPYWRASNGPNEFLVSGTTRTASVFKCPPTSPNELTTTTKGNLIETDFSGDDLARWTYGSRPSWIAIMQFNSSPVCGIPYPELRRQAYKALIGTQNRGAIGGVITWGWLDSGMSTWLLSTSYGHTDALKAHVDLADEIMGNEEAWLADPVDSSYLGMGTVVSAVSHNLTMPTATCKWYATPVRFVTKRMADGTDWIFATNLCKDAMTATFTLNSPAADTIVVSHPDGAKLTITSGQISVPLDDFGVAAIRISRPVGARATLNKSTT